LNRSSKIILIIILIFCLPLSGCYDAADVDEEVYAMAIGIDKGVDNAVRVTFQYPTYKDSPSSGGMKGGGGGQTETGEVDGTLVSTVEAPSLLEGVQMLNAAGNRQISLTHAKMLVFSEEFAREGVGKDVETVARYREARETMRVIVCKGKAQDFIMENKSLIGSNLAKGIELSFVQSQNTGYFPDVFFANFYSNMLTPYGQPYAIYAGVNDFQHLPENTQQDNQSPAPIEKDIQPGETPRKGGSKEELFGTAIFDGEKMVGSLTQNETRFFLLGIGKFKWGSFTTGDKNKPGYAYVLDVITARKPQVSAHFENGVPVIDLKVDLDADIAAIQSRIDYEKVENIKELESYTKDCFQEGMKKTIERTQKEYNCDIFHFGKKIAGNFKTIQELENYNWLKHYQEAKINVDVTVNIRRNGFFFGTRPFFSTRSGNQKEGNNQ